MVKAIFKPSEENNKIIDEYIEYYKAQNTSVKSTRNIETSLKALAHSLDKKSLKNATEEDLIKFFKTLTHPSTRAIRANHIIPFYRKIFNIPYHTKNRPSNMYWFKFPTKQEKRRSIDPNAKEKYLIEPEQYQKMLTWNHDRYGQTNALWETYYFTGARPSEIPKIKVGDVKTDSDGIVTIMLTDSKSQPREAPCPFTPHKLLEYIENHPYKDNPNAFLWFPLNRPSKNKCIDSNTVRERFSKMKKDLKLKPTLKVKSFRKTRATAVFTENKLNDSDIGKIFGWEPHTVIMRRQQYDLTNIDDLKAKYCKPSKSQPSYTQLMKTKDTTDKQQNIEISRLTSELKDLGEKQQAMATAITNISMTTAKEAIKDILKIISKDTKTLPEAFEKFIKLTTFFLDEEDIKDIENKK